MVPNQHITSTNNFRRGEESTRKNITEIRAEKWMSRNSVERLKTNGSGALLKEAENKVLDANKLP